MGHATSITDPNGVVTTLAYDARNRVWMDTKTLTAGNRTTTYLYNAFGGLAKTTRRDGSILAAQVDATGQVIAFGRGGNQKIDYARNLMGNVTTKRHTNDPANCPVGQSCPSGLSVGYQKEWEYDQLGRMTAEISPLAQQAERTEYTYDNNDNLIRQVDKGAASATRTTVNQYGPHNELLTTTDPLNQMTLYRHDGAGNIRSVTDSLAQTTYYDRDGFGQGSSCAARTPERRIGPSMRQATPPPGRGAGLSSPISTTRSIG